MIRSVTIVTTDADGDRHPAEGFCWNVEDDSFLDAVTFCVLFGVPSGSIEVIT